MVEIIIGDPPVSTDFFRNYTLESKSTQQDILFDLRRGGIDPVQYRRVGDFSSGNLGATRQLVDRGWDPKKLRALIS